MTYLVDSVIVIDHFNAVPAATKFLSQYGPLCALSAITRAEALSGFDDRTEPLALELLDAFPTLPVTVNVADKAARLRRTTRWKLPDALQAAMAIEHGLTFVTRDTKDFHSNHELDVLVPYRL